MSENHELIGKTVCYRPIFTNEVRESRVVTSKEYTNLAGDKIDRLTLENGDVVAAGEVYFESETA